MSEWWYIEGNSNIADWVTRAKKPEEIGQGMEWWQGPRFLKLLIERWEIKECNPKEVIISENVCATTNKIHTVPSVIE